MGEGDRVGQQVGNYHLEKLLGSGGFAEVYLGRQIYLDSYAAIKLLRTNLAQEEVEGFRVEARTLVHLIHPHIVRLLDFGLQGNTPFLVMDYAPNGTLRQRIRPGEKLPLATVVEYVKQVASALQYAHDEKIIHRDVKPGNMLLGRQNEILLSDFGIAVVAHSTHTALPQEMTGTMAYMAPEQIQAHPRPASDQYSLGVVVYEWLSGSPPFGGPFTEIAVKHIMTAPPPLREQIPDLAPEVEQVIFTALAKDPAQRFGSVRAFANALEQASKGARVAFPAPIEPSLTLTSPTTPIPPANVFSPVYKAPDLQEATQAAEATTDASPYSIPVASPAKAQVERPFVPRVYVPDPLTPPLFPPVQRSPETRHQGLSRRAVLIAGLSTAGVVVAGGIAWEFLSHNASHTSPQTTSQTTKKVTSSPTQRTPTPIPGLLAQDTFSRSNQTYWGTATDHLLWGGDANKLSDFAISSGMGQIHRTASGKSLYTAVLGTAHADSEVKAIASVDQFNPSHIGVILRYTDDNNYYKVFFDGSNLNMIRRLGGNNTTLQSIPFPAQANTPYTTRFQVIGTTLRARVWQTSQTEPTNWLLTATDNTFQSGLGGFRPQVNQNVTFRAALFQETIPATS